MIKALQHTADTNDPARPLLRGLVALLLLVWHAYPAVYFLAQFGVISAHQELVYYPVLDGFAKLVLCNLVVGISGVYQRASAAVAAKVEKQGVHLFFDLGSEQSSLRDVAVDVDSPSSVGLLRCNWSSVDGTSSAAEGAGGEVVDALFRKVRVPVDAMLATTRGALRVASPLLHALERHQHAGGNDGSTCSSIELTSAAGLQWEMMMRPTAVTAASLPASNVPDDSPPASFFHVTHIATASDEASRTARDWPELHQMPEWPGDATGGAADTPLLSSCDDGRMILLRTEDARHLAAAVESACRYTAASLEALAALEAHVKNIRFRSRARGASVAGGGQQSAGDVGLQPQHDQQRHLHASSSSVAHDAGVVAGCAGTAVWPVLHDAVASFRGIASHRGITIATQQSDAATDVLCTQASTDGLAYVLSTLLHASLKVCQQGGHVVVRVASITATPTMARQSAGGYSSGSTDPTGSNGIVDARTLDATVQPPRTSAPAAAGARASRVSAPAALAAALLQPATAQGANAMPAGEQISTPWPKMIRVSFTDDGPGLSDADVQKLLLELRWPAVSIPTVSPSSVTEMPVKVVKNLSPVLEADEATVGDSPIAFLRLSSSSSPSAQVTLQKHASSGCSDSTKTEVRGTSYRSTSSAAAVDGGRVQRKSIEALIGGTIGVTSVRGGGTSIFLDIPVGKLVAADGPELRTVAAPVPAPTAAEVSLAQVPPLRTHLLPAFHRQPLDVIVSVQHIHPPPCAPAAAPHSTASAPAGPPVQPMSPAHVSDPIAATACDPQHEPLSVRIPSRRPSDLMESNSWLGSGIIPLSSRCASSASAALSTSDGFHYVYGRCQGDT